MAEWLSLLVPALGRALLHFLWQGALIGLTAAIVLQLLRDARPQLRYAVACLALLACALVPILSVFLDLGAATVSSRAAATALASAAAPVGRELSLHPWPSTFGGSQFEIALPWIVSAWAAGAGALSLRMSLGIVWIQHLRNTPQPGSQAVWQARLDALAARFGLEAISLRLVDTLESPASAGWLRPVVLLPTALVTRMPVELVEALLAHELAHIRRHDYLVNLLQGVVEALLFYHPVTWWLSRRIRIERELVADQLAACATGNPHRLARALSELSEFRHRPAPSLHLAQAAHGGHLMSRIEHLVQPGRRSTAGKLAFPMLGLAAACIAFYAQAQIGDDARRQASARPLVATQARSAAPTAAGAAPHILALADAQVLAQAGNQATQVVHTGKRGHSAFALVRKDVDGITMSGSVDEDLPAIKAARRSLGGDFVWFRRDNRAYVVTDPAVIARAEAAWRDVEAHGDKMEVLGDQMEVHGARMEKIGEQMEALSPDHEPSAAMEAASERMEALAEQQQAVAEKQSRLAHGMRNADEAQREKLERQMQDLSNEQEALSRQMEQQSAVMEAESGRMEERLKPLEAMSAQMEAASKPMEALGTRMEALGAEHEKLVELAERDMEQLLQESMSKGLAKPAPGDVQAR